MQKIYIHSLLIVSFIVFSMSAMKKSSDNNHIKDALRNKRCLLSEALAGNRFNDALHIFQGSRYLLDAEVDTFLIGTLNDQFAQKFMEADYDSDTYKKYIRPLVHCGFDLEIKSKSGCPL